MGGPESEIGQSTQGSFQAPERSGGGSRKPSVIRPSVSLKIHRSFTVKTAQGLILASSVTGYPVSCSFSDKNKLLQKSWWNRITRGSCPPDCHEDSRWFACLSLRSYESNP